MASISLGVLKGYADSSDYGNFNIALNYSSISRSATGITINDAYISATNASGEKYTTNQLYIDSVTINGQSVALTGNFNGQSYIGSYPDYNGIWTSNTLSPFISIASSSTTSTTVAWTGHRTGQTGSPLSGSGTLTFDAAQETITISTTGGWYDNGNEDGLRPPFFNINLYADGALYESKSLTDGFSTTFTVPKLNSAGTEINYTLEAEQPSGYLCSPWKDASIANLWHVDMFRITSISGTITYPAGGVKAVTVYLYKNGTLVESQETTSTSYSFNGYPVYEVGDSGSSYSRNTYTVSFSTPDGWKQTQNGNNVTYSLPTYTYEVYAMDFPQYPVTIIFEDGSGCDIYTASSAGTFSCVGYSDNFITSISYNGINCPSSDYTVSTTKQDTRILMTVQYNGSATAEAVNAPYICIDGTWKKSIAYIYTGYTWKKTTPKFPGML